MKKVIIYFLISLVCLVRPAVCGVFIGGGDYTIEEELDAATLLNDYKNSIILDFLGSDGMMPDKRLEIEQIRERRPDDVDNVELRVALIIGRMDLLKLKEFMIKEFRRNQIDFLSGNYTLEKLEGINVYFRREINKILEEIRKDGGINLEEALISYSLFIPDVDYGAFASDTPPALLVNAIEIAKLRLDNHKFHREIQSCMNKKKLHLSEGILACSEDYAASVTIETVLVIKQLSPYRGYFERAERMADETDRVKVEDGKGGYLWVKP